MLENVRVDIRRYFVTDGVDNLGGVLNLFLFNYSLWVILSYRFGRWVRCGFRVPVIGQLLKLLTRVVHSILGLLTGIQIPFETVIGPGLYIGHTGMIVLNADTIIGSYCNISVGVVIGQAGRGDNRGSPVLGDYIHVGVGAKIIGKIHIGDHCAIGANAVVTKDLPLRATAAGVPARIVNYRGSSDFIKVI
jgi:serine O-acetyltransferase